MDEEQALLDGHANRDEAVLVNGVLVVGKVELRGSSNTVMASSKETPCFLRLAAALAGSNSKLGTGSAYSGDSSRR
jgi:hypothetical protein